MELIDTTISGLKLVRLDVQGDERGSFREAFNAAKSAELGLPELNPVQWNVSESVRGTLRGIHAEPWDKYINVMQGDVFGAWVDLRPDSETAGQTYTADLSVGLAVFVPKGLGNSFQVTSPSAVVGYLINAHWRPGVVYQAVAWDDPELGINWPVPDPILTDKDRSNPSLRQALALSSVE